MKNEAAQAIQDILSVISAVEVKRPLTGGKDTLIKAVETLDLYLTGKSTERKNLHGMRRDAESAESCAEYGAEWIVYLSDGGYSRLVISPNSEPNKMWLSGGPHASWEQTLSKWREVYKTY